MSVATTTSKIQYTLTTGSQALSIPFYFLDNAHIKAVTVATETVASITLVLGTDYTLTGAANPAGGTLTTIATVGNSLAAGSKVVIKRNVPITQPTSYSPNDAFPAKIHEGALDRGIMIAQQSDEQSDRAIRFPEDDSRNSVLPSAVDRALKTLVFDAEGDVSVAPIVDGGGLVLPESIGESEIEGAFRERSEISVAAMKARSYAGAVNNQRVELLGYYSAGDGGGGMLYVDKADTTTADNGVTVFVASDGTRLKRSNTNEMNARQAGARGDNLTDDTAALQRAIDAAYGKTLRITSGKYKHTGLTIDNTRAIRIIGDGWSDDAQEGTSLWNTSTGTASITISGADSDKRILISDLALVGNGASGKGISATTAHKLVLRDLLVTSHFSSGITLTNCWVTTLKECTVVNNGQHGLLVIGQGNNIKVDHCAFNQNARSAGGYANVALSGTGGNNLAITFDTCDIEGAGMNPYSTMDSAYGMIVQGTNALSIRSCYFENSYTGLFYSDSSLDGFKISETYFQDGTVSISGSKNGSFECNTLQYQTKATSVAIDAPSGANVRQFATTLLNGATMSFPSGCYERKEQFDATAPTTGTWKLNDIVWNANIASGSYIGSVCTTAGTPGTWKTFGLVS